MAGIRALYPIAILSALGSMERITTWPAIADEPLAATRPVDLPPPQMNPPHHRTPVSGTSELLADEKRPIDLATALRLAGVQNPELNVARQVVLEAVAARQLAAARFLPTLNSGASYDSHAGTLQQSNGNILSVNRSSVYVGAGSFAVASGTVWIPGVVLQGNVAEAAYGYLVSRQVVRQQEFAAEATRNDVFLRVSLAYCELIRAEGRRLLWIETMNDAAEVARITSQYARTGQGRQADADRARTELYRRRFDLRRTEGEVLVASARLCKLLNLDPSIRLHPTDAYAVPMPIVPEPVSLRELIALALLRRSEMGERRTVVRESLLALEGSKALPFSPTVLIGFSSGGFGGGSNLVRPIFGGFSGRSDFDAISYWFLRNLGVGNLALIRAANAGTRLAEFQDLAMLDRVRDEVAEAFALTHARFAQIGEVEEAVRSGMQGYQLDRERIRQGVPGEGLNPLPIEVLNSLNLLYRSRLEYLDAIVDYNQAHFRLYVALGQPPAAALAHAAPTPGAKPPNSSPSATPAPAPPDTPSPFGGPRESPTSR